MATATPNPVDQIIENEDRDAIRFTWNAWPASSVEAKKHLVVPLACVYSPLRKGANGTYSVQYEPIACRGPCRSILNPFWFVCENYYFFVNTCSSVDLRGKLWVCPFCFQRNHFPTQYADISESLLPAELQCTTIEYVLPHRTAAPPAFLLVVDTCLPEDELKVLKESLIQLLGLIPRNALVGLITFGTMVSFFEKVELFVTIDCRFKSMNLLFRSVPKLTCFKGLEILLLKEYKNFLVSVVPLALRPIGNKYNRFEI